MQNNPGSNRPGTRIKQGLLADKIREATTRASSSSTLEPIGTKTVYIEDQGIKFTVHKLESPDRKHRASLAQKRLNAAGRKDTNPFLPYDEDLYVGDLTESHAAVLNKYFVVSGHLLMITRAFVSQEMLLNDQDMEAAWVCLRELDSLVFYNGGLTAGASQPHRHLQMLALPWEQNENQFPTEPLLARGAESKTISGKGFAFVYAVANMSPFAMMAQTDTKQAAKGSLEVYAQLLDQIGLGPYKNSSRQAGPYNMLMTRRLMVLVPRSNEQTHGISINALGYAGSLLVRTDAQFEKLQSMGPIHALERVGVIKSEGIS